jgi:hypothetical protein
MANFPLLSRILIDRMRFAEQDGTSDYYKDVTDYQLRTENRRTKSEMPYRVRCKRVTKEDQCVLEESCFCTMHNIFVTLTCNLLGGAEEARQPIYSE